MKTRTKQIKQCLWAILFAGYIIALFYFMFFSEGYGRTLAGREYSYNLSLFKEIKRFIQYRETLGTMAFITNIFGNIFAFSPFGFILPILSGKIRRIWKAVFFTLELSLLIELTQLVMKVGCFDVDDLFMNTIGGCLGYLTFRVFDMLRRKKHG